MANLPKDTVVFAVDVGSRSKGNFGWVCLECDGEEFRCGCTLHGLVEAIRGAIMEGKPVALGFEMPLYVPVRDVGEDEEHEITSARGVESGMGRPFSGDAGAMVLVTGMVQVAWIFRQLLSGDKRLILT